MNKQIQKIGPDLFTMSIDGTNMFKLVFCSLVLFTKFKCIQLMSGSDEYFRTGGTSRPLYGIGSLSMSLPLNIVHKSNELIPFYVILNGTAMLVNSFRTSLNQRRQRHRRKNAYSDWSDWSWCSEKCTTTRQRRCLRPEICGSNFVTESSYCFTEGSRCLGLAMNSKLSEWNFSNKVLGNEYVSVNFTCGVTINSASFSAFKTPRYLIKIMGGRESEKINWPWHVAVLNGLKELICGGTLISPGWVLTAAHCSRKKLYVRLREYDFSIYEGDEIDLKVERIIIHPMYNPYTIDNDLALLKLRTLDLKKNGVHYLQPACLPRFDFQRHKRKPTICMIIGWGKAQSQDLYGSQVLREARVPIVKQRTCRAAYRRYLITDNMFCAGYRDGRSDTCSGDSGGPLLCKMHGRWTVVGVTSFGDGCGRRGKYGIYASVANHVRWIKSMITTFEYE